MNTAPCSILAERQPDNAVVLYTHIPSSVYFPPLVVYEFVEGEVGPMQRAWVAEWHRLGHEATEGAQDRENLGAGA